MRPSAYLILATRHKKKTGKYPLKLRLVYNRVAKDFRTGIDLAEDDFKNATIDRPKAQFRQVSIKLVSIKDRANKIIDEMGVFTFQRFEDAFYMRLKDASNIFPFFEEYIESLMKEDRIKTAISYRNSMNSFKTFSTKISFYDITSDFLKKYHKWMMAHGKLETTIGIYARSLRAIYNYGISKGTISDKEYPFGKGKYVIPGGRNIKKALTLEEVARIYNYETVKGTSADKAKDFWFLSYFCNGINFKDIALLKNKNIDGDMLRFVRQKTKNTTRANQTVISCYISEPVRDIINKWRNKNEYPTSYLFDFIEDEDDVITQTKKISNFIHNTNDHMKRICRDLGISKLATTYYSRHSAATIMKKSGASVEQIREALGHQSTSTTQKYLDSFDDETKKTLSQELSKFLRKEAD